MATLFIVNGQERKLEMRDKNGIDWSADFIGNTSHGMAQDDEGRYIATDEDYQWWSDCIAAHEAANEMIEQYKFTHGSDAVEEALSAHHVGDYDLEDQPDAVKKALEEWFS